MRSADGKASPALVPKLGRQVADTLGFLKDAERAIDDLLASWRDTREIAAFAHEYLKAQLIFEQLDLLAYPGLRRMQLLGGRRDVETALGHCGEITQLVQLHFFVSLRTG